MEYEINKHLVEVEFNGGSGYENEPEMWYVFVDNDLADTYPYQPDYSELVDTLDSYMN